MQVFEREAAVTEYEFVCTGDSGENRLEICKQMACKVARRSLCGIAFETNHF